MTFGQTFKVGISITLVSCACCVAVWEFIYFGLDTGFVDQYAAHAIEQARQSGASEQQIAATARQLEEFKEMYQNPLFNAITFSRHFRSGWW